MKIKELIAELEQYDGATTVVIEQHTDTGFLYREIIKIRYDIGEVYDYRTGNKKGFVKVANLKASW